MHDPIPVVPADNASDKTEHWPDLNEKSDGWGQSTHVLCEIYFPDKQKMALVLSHFCVFGFHV